MKQEKNAMATTTATSTATPARDTLSQETIEHLKKLAECRMNSRLIGELIAYKRFRDEFFQFTDAEKLAKQLEESGLDYKFTEKQVGVIDRMLQHGTDLKVVLATTHVAIEMALYGKCDEERICRWPCG